MVGIPETRIELDRFSGLLVEFSEWQAVISGWVPNSESTEFVLEESLPRYLLTAFAQALRHAEDIIHCWVLTQWVFLAPCYNKFVRSLASDSDSRCFCTMFLQKFSNSLDCCILFLVCSNQYLYFYFPPLSLISERVVPAESWGHRPARVRLRRKWEPPNWRPWFWKILKEQRGAACLGTG